MSRRIYLASSWRNEKQPDLVNTLIAHDHQVYDFRNPPSGVSGFQWSELDPDWQLWGTQQYRAALEKHPRAAQGFMNDLRGMQWCDTCILLQPAGRSAHLEAGWCAGNGKYTLVLLASGEPELMVLLAHKLCIDENELLEALK